MKLDRALRMHVWTLSWFHIENDVLEGEVVLPIGDLDAAQILDVPEDELLAGEFPIDSKRAVRLKRIAGAIVQFERFAYFLGATATNPESLTPVNVAPVPEQVVQLTESWLNEIDAGLASITTAASALDSAVLSAITPAVADVAQRVENFRLALAGHVDLGRLLPSRWTPLGTVEHNVAEAIHAAVLRVAALPPEVTDAAHSLVNDDALRQAFMRQVGDVAGAAFVNLARSLWNDYPDLAPLEWSARSSSDE